jgi:hypothetical protein
MAADKGLVANGSIPISRVLGGIVFNGGVIPTLGFSQMCRRATARRN